MTSLVQRQLSSLFAASIVLAAHSFGVSAKPPRLSDSRDRALQPDALGGPGVELAVPPQMVTDTAALRVFLMGRVPLGFEGVDVAPLSRTQVARIDMTGATVGDALDTLVRADRRYAWHPMGDVVVLRPRSAWANPDNWLNRRVQDIDWSDVTAEDAYWNVARLLSGTSNRASTPWASTHDTRLLSIRVRTGSVLDVLNAIVQAHGALMWSVVYVTPGRGGLEHTNDPYLRFMWPDGRGIGSTLKGSGPERWDTEPAAEPRAGSFDTNHVPVISEVRRWRMWEVHTSIRLASWFRLFLGLALV